MPTNFKRPKREKALADYRINIVGLGNKAHHFTFEIGDNFFKVYGENLLQKGSFTADIELNKLETFLEADFSIKGTASLICDRSLEDFDYHVETNHKIVFKYGDEAQELTDEIIIINRDTVSLDVGQYIYEFIALSIPMKRLHPKFNDEDDDNNDIEGKIIYSSGNREDEDDEDDNENNDPRWDQLKKLI